MGRELTSRKIAFLGLRGETWAPPPPGWTQLTSEGSVPSGSQVASLCLRRSVDGSLRTSIQTGVLPDPASRHPSPLSPPARWLRRELNLSSDAQLPLNRADWC